MITDLLVPKSNPIVSAVKAKDKEVKEEKSHLNESDPGTFMMKYTLIYYIFH